MLSFHRGIKTAAGAGLLLFFIFCRPGAAQPIRAPDFHEVHKGFVRILCQDLSLEESVRLIRSTPKVPEAIAKSFSLSQEDHLDAALAALEKIPKPIEEKGARFLYWELLGYIQQRRGNIPAARGSLRELLALGDTEQTRIDLSVWKYLRDLGEKPAAAEGDRVLGAVVQVNMSSHLMAVAGYADGSPRISTDTGISIIGGKSRFPSEIRKGAESLTRVSQRALDQVPLFGDCAAPQVGEVRFSLLTTAGIRTRTLSIEDVQKSDHPLHDLWTVSNNLFGMLLKFYNDLAQSGQKSGQI